MIGGGRHKAYAAISVLQPDLGAPKLARISVPSALTPQQYPVQVSQQIERDRITIRSHALQTGSHGGDIIRDFFDIVHGNARHGVNLMQQQIGE